MTNGRGVTTETAAIHGRRPDPDPARARRSRGGPAPVRRRRVGPLRAHPGPRPRRVRAHLLEVVPGRVGRAGEDPDRRRRPPGGQPRRRHPLRRPGDHARDREGAGASRLWPGRLLLPYRARWWARSGPGPGASRLVRPTPTACSRNSSSWPWSSPKAPRAHPSRSPTGISFGASAGADSWRSPCGPVCR